MLSNKYLIEKTIQLLEENNLSLIGTREYQQMTAVSHSVK
jgi:hypothetical protein